MARALAAAGRVDVAVVVWGASGMAAQVLAWQRIEVPQDTVRLARTIAGLPRRVSCNTGIGSGLSAALDLLEAHGHCGA